jgi:hypothetical protein
VDFFTVPTATFRVLFCFLIMRHDRRKVVHVGVTAHPSAALTAQQLIEAFPYFYSSILILENSAV